VKRKDLETGILVDPGLYLIDGEEDDPEGRVLQGPFPDTAEGRNAAEILGQQYLDRGRRVVTLCKVVELPRG
jgi:hypothetical protein